MNNSNPTLAAARQQLREIRQSAEALDLDLGAVQAAELRGERSLTTLTAAGLLCRLHAVNEQLTAEMDTLSEEIGDLDQRHQHDGSGAARDR